MTEKKRKDVPAHGISESFNQIVTWAASCACSYDDNAKASNSTRKGLSLEDNDDDDFDKGNSAQEYQEVPGSTAAYNPAIRHEQVHQTKVNSAEAASKIRVFNRSRHVLHFILSSDPNSRGEVKADSYGMTGAHFVLNLPKRAVHLRARLSPGESTQFDTKSPQNFISGYTEIGHNKIKVFRCVKGILSGTDFTATDQMIDSADEKESTFFDYLFEK